MAMLADMPVSQNLVEKDFLPPASRKSFWSFESQLLTTRTREVFAIELTMLF